MITNNNVQLYTSTPSHDEPIHNQLSSLERLSTISNLNPQEIQREPGTHSVSLNSATQFNYMSQIQHANGVDSHSPLLPSSIYDLVFPPKNELMDDDPSIQFKKANGQITLLPVEVLEIVMTHLGPSDVSRMRSVCQTMRNVVEHLRPQYLATISTHGEQTLKAIPGLGIRLIPARDLCIKAAKSIFTSDPILLTLAHTGDSYIRTLLVEGMRIPEKALPILVQDQSSYVRSKVAAYLDTSEDLLHSLARDPSDSVRNAVAYNFKTRQDTIRILVDKNSDPCVWYFLAKKPNTPLDILIRMAVNANMVAEVISALMVAHQHKEIVRRAVATNPNTSLSLLRRLARDESMMVRLGVARNSSTPPDILYLMKNDKCKVVRQAALEHSNVPKGFFKSFKLFSSLKS